MPRKTWSHSSETDLGPMTSHPLTPDRFGDMEAVFGDRGVARSCFCMHWRRPDGGFGTSGTTETVSPTWQPKDDPPA